jgi:AraC family transcriptional regulator of adaptative response/methylated-DNA-[protein]-cysteine methyltransferase
MHGLFDHHAPEESQKSIEGDFGQAAAGLAALVAGWIDSPLGPMLVVADNEGVRLLDFADRRGLVAQLARLRSDLGAYIRLGESVVIEAAREVMGRFFTSAERAVDRSVPVGLFRPTPSATAFQRRVWDALVRIPLGETRSYMQQAQELGQPGAVRAVARANGANFLAIVVPCHRVIGTDGSLTGYGGGLPRKRWLLEHERAIVRANGTWPARSEGSVGCADEAIENGAARLVAPTAAAASAAATASSAAAAASAITAAAAAC